MQRLRCCELTCSSAGTATRQASTANLQRGEKAQPLGMFIRLGTMPGMAASFSPNLFHPRCIAKARHGGEKAHRVGMLGIAENLADRPFFDDSA